MFEQAKRVNPLVKIIRYKPSHYQTVVDMHQYQEQAGFKHDVPKLGYIVKEGKSPVCAGFLRMIEGKYCQIDTLVSNPHHSAPLRHKCMNLLVETLINKAKSLKLKGIMSTTIDNSVIMRAVQVGFTVLPHVVIALPIEDSKGNI